MSYGRGNPYHGQGNIPTSQGGVTGPEGIEDYYGSIPSQWDPEGASPFSAIPQPYCSEPFPPPGTVLTPISLPDSTFAHASPNSVASHHSQDYPYNVGVPVTGLGISTAFHPQFSQAVAPTPIMDYQPLIEQNLNIAPEPSPAVPARRTRRSSRQAAPVRETPVRILPDPEGLERLERERRQSEAHSQPPPRPGGRGRRDPQIEEEDAFVWRMREEEHQSWRVVTQSFHRRFNKPVSEPTLQMRLKRLRERLARWDENDIQILIRARDHFEKEKFKLISQLMQELGASVPYTAEQCEAQLRALDKQNREKQQEETKLSSQSRTSDSRHSRKRRRPDTPPAGK